MKNIFIIKIIIIKKNENVDLIIGLRYFVNENSQVSMKKV